MKSRGGVLLRIAPDGLVFVPSDVVERVAALSALTPVPGLEAPGWGIALAEGDVVTVLSIGRDVAPRERPRWDPGDGWPMPGAHHAVICRLEGTAVALTGGAIVETGVFDVGDDGRVLWRDAPVPTLDVQGLYAQAEAAIWAARAVSRAPAEARARTGPLLLDGPTSEPPSTLGGAS